MSFQVMPMMEPDAYVALRDSIARWGVLVPVLVDMSGRILDGHHRVKIAGELGIEYPTNSVAVDGDEDATAVALTVNLDRRHMPAAQRREVVAHLRSQGHSLRAIAGAIGSSKSQVQKDVNELSTSGQLTDEPERITGLDGRSRPATRKEADVEAAEVQEARRRPQVEARPPAPSKFGGSRRNHRDQIDALCHSLAGFVLAFEEVAELDESVTNEEAARLKGDLSMQLRAFRRLTKMIGDRT